MASTCSGLTIETLEQGVKYVQSLKTQGGRHRRLSGVFIVNFEHISYLVLVFLLLTLNSKCRLGKNFPVSSQQKKYFKKI